jgi:6-phosphofructokinase 2
MKSVLTITLNPTIDKNYFVDKLVPDHKLRCANPRVDPGGGGINVAKAIGRLRGEVIAMVLSGGRNGAHLRELLEKEQIPAIFVDTEAETRESVVISEKFSHQQYRLVLEGPMISAGVQKQFMLQLEGMNPFPEIVVASGSLPLGIPEDFYAYIAKLVARKNSKFILDTSGNALAKGIVGGIYLVKPNLRELSVLSGQKELQLDQVDEAAQLLIEDGRASLVVVSMGAAGAMLVQRDSYRLIPAPAVPKKSTVGAGDSMVAGMVHAIQQGMSPEEMVMMGVACGTAATMNEGTQLFKTEDALRLFEWIRRQR